MDHEIGEGEEFDESSGDIKRYPTIPPTQGLNKFLAFALPYMPTNSILPILIGELDNKWKTTVNFEYWLRAYSSCPIKSDT